MLELQLLEKNFKELMQNKDFDSFKRAYPTLYSVITLTLSQVKQKSFLKEEVLPAKEAAKRHIDAYFKLAKTDNKLKMAKYNSFISGFNEGALYKEKQN